jgi:hypothetical protein
MVTVMDFRQGSKGRFEVRFISQSGTMVDQPAFLPTIEVIYIHPTLLQPVTAIPTTIMNRVQVGVYFINWLIPINEPTIEHEIIYRGVMDGLEVIGEDTVTILPLTAVCVFTPTLITTVSCCN